MKIITFALAASILAHSAISMAENAPAPQGEQGLRPLQKFMRERAAWMKAMNENLLANKFDAVARDADALSAQAKKIGEAAPNPLARELHLAVSENAGKVSAAAAKADAEAVKGGLGDIKAKCAECHARIRDKK